MAWGYRAARHGPQDGDAACSVIRKPDPRPGWRYSAPDVRFLIPDVVVRKVHGKWIVRLNQSVVVRVNRMYAELLHSHRDSRHSELASHLQEGAADGSTASACRVRSRRDSGGSLKT